MAQGSASSSRSLPDREFPFGPDEVTGISAGIAFEVILMLALRLPKSAGGLHFGDHFAWPEAGGVEIGDCILGDPFLLVGRIAYG